MTTTSTYEKTARRWIGGSIAAVLLVVLAAAPALAVSWGSETLLSSTMTHRPEIVRTGAASALVIWKAGGSIYARRTSDAGRTWTSPATLATGAGIVPAVSASARRSISRT